MAKSIICIFSTALLVLAWPGMSQEAWEEQGEIESAEVVIEKDVEIQLPAQPRNFEKIPPFTAGTGGIRQEYSFPTWSISLPSSLVEVKALKLQEEPLEKFYGNLVRLGLANYSSPLAEIYLYSKRNESYLFGVQAKHLSFGKGPVDGKNSGSSDSQVKAEGSFYQENLAGGGEVFYNRAGWNFYGYDPSVGVTEGEDSLRHTFNRYGASFYLGNEPSPSGIRINGRGSFKGQSDNFEVSENWLNIDTRLSKEVSDGLSARLGILADVIGYNSGTSIGRQRAGLEPSVVYTKDKYSVTAGLRYVYQSDSVLPKSQVYPLLKGSYSLAPPFNVFAELQGDSKLNTWQSFTLANPYLGKTVDLHNTNEILHVGLGISGNTSFLAYKVGFNRRVLKEFALFLNNAADQSKFLVVYDTANFKISEFYAQGDFYAGTSLTVTAEAATYLYDSDSFGGEAWHLPGYRIMLSASYEAFNKLRTKAGLIYTGGVRGWDSNLQAAKDLAPGADVFLDIDYLLSERATIFLKFNNMVNQNYELLSYYPVRGLTLRAGFSYSF